MSYYKSTAKNSYRDSRNKKNLTPDWYKKYINSREKSTLSGDQNYIKDSFSYNYTAINNKSYISSNENNEANIYLKLNKINLKKI